MKKIIPLSVLAMLLSGLIIAQDQLENPGFEQWDNIFAAGNDTIREPVDWSSLKTSDDPTLSTLAPVVCTRSNDAHSGNYSVKLTNVFSFIVANGVASNGRFHPDFDATKAYVYTDTADGQWNTPFTSRPDSITGWFKYTPQANDSLQVKVVLHRGYGTQPDAAYRVNWIGVAEYISPLNSGDAWVRFSAPFVYFSDDDPEYVLVVLNSGSGYTPVTGSIVLFDDLEMIYSNTRSPTHRALGTAGLIYVMENRFLVLKDVELSMFQTIRIHEITGKLVWTAPVSEREVDISSVNLNQGIYIISLAGESHLFSQKIMLQ